MKPKRLQSILILVVLALAAAGTSAKDHPPEDVMMRAIPGQAPEPSGRHVASFAADEETRAYLDRSIGPNADTTAEDQ